MMRFFTTALLSAGIAAILIPPAGADPVIAVFMTRDLEPHRQVLAGFQEELAGAGIEAVWDIYHLPKGEEERDETARRAVESQADLILALGTSAAQTAARVTSRIPIVFANVLNPRASGLIEDFQILPENVTGAALDFPPEEIIAVLNVIEPERNRVGLIYRDPGFDKLVGEMETALRQSGKELLSRRIENLEDLNQAADEILPRVDAFWMIADQHLFSPQATRQLLLRTMRRGIPFIGISPAYVRAGALFCLDWDSRDIGRQAGESAVRILGGTDPFRIPVSRPRKQQIHLNRTVLANLEIEIPDSILKESVSSAR